MAALLDDVLDARRLVAGHLDGAHDVVAREAVREERAALDAVAPAAERLRPEPVVRGAGCAGRRIERDADPDETLAGGIRARAERTGVRSQIDYPLTVSGEFRGVISIYNTEKMHSWTEDELLLVEAVAAQLATGIAQAELFEMVARAAFANPFGETRDDLDLLIGGAAPGSSAEDILRAVVTRIEERIGSMRKRGTADLRRQEGNRRNVLRTVILFHLFHRHMADFDRLIQAQLKTNNFAPSLSFLYGRGLFATCSAGGPLSSGTGLASSDPFRLHSRPGLNRSDVHECRNHRTHRGVVVDRMAGRRKATRQVLVGPTGFCRPGAAPPGSYGPCPLAHRVGLSRTERGTRLGSF